MPPRAAATSGCPSLRDRPRDKPFFLWLAALDPHRDYEPGTIPEPHRPEDVVVPPYLPDVPEVRKDLALYYDEIGRLDHYVGEVLAELDRQGDRRGYAGPVPQRQRPAVPPLQDDALRQRDQDAR